MANFKINYFFFIMAIGIPVVMTPVGIILFWPLIFNPYQLMPPMWTILTGVLFSASILWFAVAYMAIPWIAVIKEDRITFHRLFRKKLVIDLSKVKYAELHGELEGRRKGNHISFIMDNGERWIAMGLNYEMTVAVLEHLKKKKIEVRQYAGEMSDEEWKQHIRRGY